jgi:hypothetical protein
MAWLPCQRCHHQCRCGTWLWPSPANRTHQKQQRPHVRRLHCGRVGIKHRFTLGPDVKKAPEGAFCVDCHIALQAFSPKAAFLGWSRETCFGKLYLVIQVVQPATP